MHEHVYVFEYARHNYEVLSCYCGKTIRVYDE